MGLSLLYPSSHIPADSGFCPHANFLISEPLANVTLHSYARNMIISIAGENFHWLGLKPRAPILFSLAMLNNNTHTHAGRQTFAIVAVDEMRTFCAPLLLLQPGE